MKIHLLTLFPDMCRAVLKESIIGRACESGIADIEEYDIRDYSTDKHRKVDDYTFGGGQGMVMFPQPVFSCLEEIDSPGRKIYMSPRGKVMDGDMITSLSREEELVILCGHYEGVDQRIIDHWGMEEVSIGDYILTGGELPALVLIDSVIRMLPGVLAGEGSRTDESIYSGLLEYPQYSQPREFEGLEVPEVLLSGHHVNIALWRYEESLKLTKERRPDLFERYVRDTDINSLTKEEKKILMKYTDTDSDGGKR